MRCLAAALLLLACGGPARAQRASFEELQTFSAVLNLIRLNHVDSVSYTPLVRAAIQGALGAIDPHSSYVRRDVAEALIAARSGELGTPGIEMTAIRGAVTVTGVGAGSPAAKAGMLTGDRIIEIGDSSIAGLQPHEVELLLAARAGTERRVRVERGDPLAPVRLDLRIRLERYTWPSVTSTMMLAEDAGYVQLGVFSPGATAQLERSVDALRRRGMRRLVLDLRGNPGGLLSEVVSIAALFLERDVLVFRTVGRKADTNAEYRTRSAGEFRDVPLVLIVDGSSASAAEALAGALQDHGRALIVGHRTFGKALVQSPFPLPAGDVLWLTIARVVTPAGRMIQRSYDGLTTAQYRALDDALRRGGPDTTERITGGIKPDVQLPPRPESMAWWDEAQRTGLDVAIVQRTTLSGDDAHAWREPLRATLRSMLLEQGVATAMTSEQEHAAIRHLTYLAIASRSGTDAAAAFIARTDPEIARAIAALDEPAARR